MEGTSDTLTLAGEERAKQGIHELEISFGGELDLHKHFHKCQKNPGHPDFIPVNKFQEYHLPKHRRSNKIAEWIRKISNATVKLSVNYVSPNRPSGYPLSDRAGQRVLSVGSGFVADISLTENNDKLPCPLENCGHGPEYHEVFGYITVVTAAHVVFDDEEVKNTTVEFFYDDSSDRSGVMKASGVRVAASSVEGDFCELLCVTHETDLIERLKYKSMYAKNDVSHTQPTTVEERTRQLIQELEISFGGEFDLHKYFIKCWENAEYPDVIRVNELKKLHLSKLRYSRENADYVRRISGVRVKLSVNYVSPNRPSGYPLSDRAGQRVLSVGSGFVADISLTGNSHRLLCPLKNCGHRAGYHVVFGYITVVTAAHVVFDDEEAQNTTVEIVLDPLFGVRRRVMIGNGVRVAASSVEGGLCALLCVTHERNFLKKFKHEFILRKKREDICQIFETLLPGLESIQYMSNADSQFLAKIRLSNLGEAVKALIVLKAFTEDLIDHVLRYWNPSNNSLSDVLEHASFSKEYTLALIKFEECIVEGIHREKPDPDFLSELRDLYSRSCGNNNIKTRLFCQEAILSLISEIGKHCSTLDSFETVLSLWDSSRCRHFLNINKVMDVSNGIATITVTLSKEHTISSRVSRKRLATASSDSETNPDDTRSNPDDMFLVHIAHPHGQSKHVTIGRQTDCFTGDGFYHQLYTARTCPGCSGGPVWMIPASGDLSEIYGVPHSGCHGNQLNKGCSWTVYPLKTT
ncbi:hypothetical protein BsWGS_24482 [Bradybaena similaris]